MNRPHRAEAIVLAALFIVMGLLIVVGKASARPFNPALRHDVSIAAHFWKAEPTRCTSIEYTVGHPASVSDEGETPWGWEPGYVPEEGGAEVAEAPPLAEATVAYEGYSGPCVMVIAERLITPVFRRHLLCGVVIHEFGHLLGREHSNNPRSIMAPEIYAWNLPRVCR